MIKTKAFGAFMLYLSYCCQYAVPFLFTYTAMTALDYVMGSDFLSVVMFVFIFGFGAIAMTDKKAETKYEKAHTSIDSVLSIVYVPFVAMLYLWICEGYINTQFNSVLEALNYDGNIHALVYVGNLFALTIKAVWKHLSIVLDRE